MPLIPNDSHSLRLSRRDALRLIGLGLLVPTLPSLLTGCGDDDSGTPPLSYDATIADARAAIAQAMADTQTPSISVALCDGERIIWRETFGYIDQAKSIPPAWIPCTASARAAR